MRDGKFEFTVTNQKCGVKSVGDQYLNEKAQGQYCILSIKVENIGNEPQTLFADNQYGFDAKGRKFAPDTGAMVSAGDSDAWISEINPGNSVTGKLIYDVPKGDKLVQLEVHDSAFSGGETITL